ncbi:MAG: glycosyltransferase [Bradyrhizobium sp.]|nr:MAG: glycosyltransferase [Bradyrhizobium sp.]
MTNCAIVIAPHFDKGGANNLFAAQCEYYRRKNWRVLLILCAEFKKRKYEYRNFRSELRADLVTTLHLGSAEKDIRFLISHRLLGEDSDDFVHRNFMNRAGRLDPEATAFLRGKEVKEICVNWCDNVDLAIALRRRFGQESARIVLHTHDVMADWSAWNQKRGARRRGLELKWSAAADHLVHVSEVDARYYARELGRSQTTSYVTLDPTVENALTLLSRRPKRSTILYVGSWNVANPPGMDWFFRQVLPFVDPDAKIVIAGSICGYIRERLSHQYGRHANVHLLGPVDDIAEYYERAAVVMMPTMSATGASIKFIEALAMGAPFVLSAPALRGAPEAVKAAVKPFVADRPIEFANKLNAMLGGEPPAVDLRRLYWEHFSNEAFFRRLGAASEAAQAERGAASAS